MDFMAAKSEADGFAEQRKMQNAKMAKIIVQAMVKEVNKNRGNLTVADKKLHQLLSMFPAEDQLEIMIQVFYAMC